MHIFCSNYHKQIAYENLKDDVSLLRIRKYIYLYFEFYFNDDVVIGVKNIFQRPEKEIHLKKSN